MINRHVIISKIIIKCVIIIASIILLYFNYLSIIFERAIVLTAGNLSNYIIIIPFLIGFILYKKRRILLFASARNNSKIEIIIGASLTALAIVISIYGSLSLYALEYNIWSIPIFIAGMTLLLFNFNILRHIIFPLVLLVYLQPLPPELVAGLAADLSYFSAILVENALKSFMPISFESSYGAPALVIEKDGKVPFYVGEPSSGIYSLVGLSLFGLFVAYLMKSKFIVKLLVFAMGFPMFFILNVFRIALILVLWYNYGEVVSESFHAVSGVVTAVIGTVALLLIADKVFKMPFKKVDSYKCITKHTNNIFCSMCGRIIQLPQNRFNKDMFERIGIALLLIIAGLGFHSYSEATSQLVDSPITELNINEIKGPETTNIFLPSIDGYELRYLYRDKRIESVLNQDAALAYAYSLSNNLTSDKINIYIGVQISSGIHTWESSMVTYPSKVGRPTATVLELTDIRISDEQNARFFVYKRPNSTLTEAVIYWFERLPLRFDDRYEQRNIQIIIWSYTDTLLKAKIINSTDDIEGIKRFYLTIAQPISEHWDNIEDILKGERALDALILERSKDISYLILIPSIIASLHYYINKHSLYKKSKNLYNNLDAISRNILNILSKPMKGDEIYNRCKESNPTLSVEEFVNKLEVLRLARLIDYYISEENDEPVIKWYIKDCININIFNHF